MSTVAGSARAAMKSRNGAIVGAKASSGGSVPAIIGSMPASQASVKTGSITNQVRNSARLTIIMFGGACCTPIAWRRIESTVTMNGKQVTMIARPGASESRVIRRKSWTVRRLNDWPSPRSMVTAWAWAGPARRSAASEQEQEAARSRARDPGARRSATRNTARSCRRYPRDVPVPRREYLRQEEVRGRAPAAARRGAPRPQSSCEKSATSVRRTPSRPESSPISCSSPRAISRSPM